MNLSVFTALVRTISGLILLFLLANCSQKTGAGETTATNQSPASNNIPSEESTSEEDARKTIVFFGNSLSAGYGLDPEEAFPALVQQKIDSLELPYKVVNAGLSGETSAGGKTRIDWVLRNDVAVFVLELGGNDGLRGISVPAMEENLQAIIDKVRTKYPEAKILVAGMESPPNMGSDYTSAFREVFPRLAARNQAALVPFLLENVAGEPKLNQADGIHPTAKGHQIVAQNVWTVLQGLLSEA